jgi:hypothetical protein
MKKLFLFLFIIIFSCNHNSTSFEQKEDKSPDEHKTPFYYQDTTWFKLGMSFKYTHPDSPGFVFYQTYHHKNSHSKAKEIVCADINDDMILPVSWEFKVFNNAEDPNLYYEITMLSADEYWVKSFYCK